MFYRLQICCANPVVTCGLLNKADSDSFPNLEVFYFVGKLIAKSLLENISINTCYNKYIYKLILNEEITLADLVFIDKPVCNR